ncbi:extracellular ribonuclease precursor [Flavobacterium saliperosum S13]|uniref:Por secretion system C-terminal sorting domain-containing protein n=2 Tax=Flavobacterium saliperosum TaxID=329186 RepID=A0A1G4W2Z6_9FLAO|nr:endonuclease [Flavobacterium saliperosum]ESU27545.1 extracellular ribonuclease precursor [Flavobacterium saliperosum S13]SCX15173.1 Por secretion system C-terminal sorting domain-containing protein [Flavobacterium saliperosum]
MKKIYSLVLLLSVAFGFAQTGVPPGYYSTATGTGYTLKTQLFNIIDNHTDRTYAGLYTTYLTSDIDSYYENDGTMLDMYTENPTGAECAFTYGTNQDDGTGGGSECDKYNREHIIPQSVFGSANPMVSDAHFVTPSDKYVNAQRDNFPFGVVQTATNTYSNGSKKGNNLNSGYSAGYSGTVFEPINEFKGDIARMILYFATRYEDQVAGWSYAMFNNTSNQVFTNTHLEILKQWHILDPVSQREIDRNNAIYARQNNRNPYIDHPEWVAVIWGPTLGTDTFDALANVTVYPNPTRDNRINITSEVELNEIQLINLNGQVIQMIKNPNRVQNTYTLENLPQGFYFVKLSSADNQTTTKKILVN